MAYIVSKAKVGYACLSGNERGSASLECFKAAREGHATDYSSSEETRYCSVRASMDGVVQEWKDCAVHERVCFPPGNISWDILCDIDEYAIGKHILGMSELKTSPLNVSRLSKTFVGLLIMDRRRHCLLPVRDLQYSSTIWIVQLWLLMCSIPRSPRKMQSRHNCRNHPSPER